jgi:dihydrofolate synthase/folylpolyglutamate synthase
MWTFSPDREVESAVQALRLRYPPLYPDGLERPLHFLQKLGNPQERLPFVFHVAGTNGKGSTLAFLHAIFEAGGMRVHKFTSPHLVRFEERIILAGRMIAPDLFLSLMAECDRADSDVSFFEFFTILAVLAFSRTPADVVLLETGLGGLNDATNVLSGNSKNIVSILTRISYDHQHVLGQSLAEIARHKAGIIKPYCPCIVSPPVDAEVLGVFKAVVAEKNAPLYVHGQEWQVTPHDTYFDYQSARHSFRLPLPQLQGAHQVLNAGTAIAAVEQSPFAHLLTAEILTQAMQKVVWAGRMQRLTAGALVDLLPQGWELWLDGAHNDSGAEVVTAQARAWADESRLKPLHLITAMKKKKDSAAFYRPLLPVVKTIQAVATDGIEAPMLSPQELCHSLQQMGFSAATVADNILKAVQSLVFQFDTPQRILITGSLYLAGHVLREFYSGTETMEENSHEATHRAGG